MKRIHVFIYGDVIGVFFRANIREKARALGLKGYVRNLEDKVEAVFEGLDDKIKEIMEFCKNPGFTEVDRIEVKEESYKGEFDSFEIVY